MCGRRTPARRRHYFFRAPAVRYFNIDSRASASSSGTGGARYGGGRLRAVGAHPSPSAARRAESAIRGPEGLWGGTGGAAAARAWARVGSRAARQRGRASPGLRGGAPEQDPRLPGMRMKLMLTIKFVAGKALSCSSGHIIRARPGCLNRVRVSSGESSLRIASCPLSRV